MDKNNSIEILTALSHSTRLDAFRLLVKTAPGGLPAGEIGKRLGVVQNTMSSHLAILERAGVVSSKRHGRSIEYSANFKAVRELLVFLMQDCCQGAPEICEPLLEAVSCSAPRKGGV